ncbi:MAG: cob(I)yrinic acid a,c-diamide adenosyltransferase [Thermoplasmataceae archaeon]
MVEVAVRLSKGLVEVYTGNGKGKTTAAFGLAFRALGWGMKVYVIQFMKLGTYGENRSAARVDGNLVVEYVGMPYFIAWEEDIPSEDRNRIRNVVIRPRGKPPEEYAEKAMKAFRTMKEHISEGNWDVVIMDEINVAIYYNLLPLKDVLDFIDNRPAHTEIVLTGRKMPDQIIERADLITEMREVKHPYAAGIPARKGIDF